MKNKKGFTLIELLAVIAIIALISLIAIPNIVGLSTGVKKDQMLDDAKKLISLAKYQVNKSYAIRANPPHTFTLAELNTKGDIEESPDGGNYLSGSVEYSVVSGTATYKVYLESTKRKICEMPSGCSTASCCTNLVSESDLHQRSKVIDK